MLELETLKDEVFSVWGGIELGKGEAWELLWPSLPLYRKRSVNQKIEVDMQKEN